MPERTGADDRSYNAPPTAESRTCPTSRLFCSDKSGACPTWNPRLPLRSRGVPGPAGPRRDRPAPAAGDPAGLRGPVRGRLGGRLHPGGALGPTVIGVLAALSFLVDFLASLFGAKRAGASPLALVGATIGAIVGLFFGIPGLILGPFVGAVAGRVHRPARAASRPARWGWGPGWGCVFGGGHQGRDRLPDDRDLLRLLRAQRLAEVDLVDITDELLVGVLEAVDERVEEALVEEAPAGKRGRAQVLGADLHHDARRRWW